VRLKGRASGIYRNIKEEIRKRVQLKESLKYLENFEITNNKEEILQRQKYFKNNLPKIEPKLKDALAQIKSIEFKERYFRDRLLVVEETEMEKAKALGICDVSLKPEEGYELILSTIGYGIDVNLSLSQIAPEIYILPLWENRDTLEALSKISDVLGEESVAKKILGELQELNELIERKRIIRNLYEIAKREERELNSRIEKKIKEFSLTLKGEELLEFLKKMKNGDFNGMLSHFSEIENYIFEEMKKSEDRLSKLLDFEVELFSRENLYPIEIPSEIIERLAVEVERKMKIELYFKSLEIMRKIEDLLPKLEDELKRAYELEFLRAVKEFVKDFTFPEIKDGGIAFLNAKHLFIKNPQPISYVVGRIAELDGTKGENVIILTGANSGGKTSLLELIVQIEILAHMGFPVNAEKAWIEPLDELFFFTKTHSSYGAGAFETAIKSFARSLIGEGRKMILIDEFEAITEPGAGVKIIAELLRIAQEKEFYVIVVSHLGEELKKVLPFARVDGIEARGLDERLNLIVDRQPKFGVLGKSTPELIVEKLYRTKSGKEKKIFERVWNSFKNWKNQK
jgi:dsDNA-specific endonuclease/ATPase MutS2